MDGLPIGGDPAAWKIVRKIITFVCLCVTSSITHNNATRSCYTNNSILCVWISGHTSAYVRVCMYLNVLMTLDHVNIRNLRKYHSINDYDIEVTGTTNII